jgi:hypothetical protein
MRSATSSVIRRAGAVCSSSISWTLRKLGPTTFQWMCLSTRWRSMRATSRSSRIETTSPACSASRPGTLRWGWVLMGVLSMTNLRVRSSPRGASQTVTDRTARRGLCRRRSGHSSPWPPLTTSDDTPRSSADQRRLPGADLVDRGLDRIEDGLPALPAAVFRIQRSVAERIVDQSRHALCVVGDAVSSTVSVGRTATRTVTGTARHAGEESADVATVGVRRTVGQARAQTARTPTRPGKRVPPSPTSCVTWPTRPSRRSPMSPTRSRQRRPRRFRARPCRMTTGRRRTSTNSPRTSTSTAGPP